MIHKYSGPSREFRHFGPAFFNTFWLLGMGPVPGNRARESGVGKGFSLATLRTYKHREKLLTKSKASYKVGLRKLILL